MCAVRHCFGRCQDRIMSRSRRCSRGNNRSYCRRPAFGKAGAGSRTADHAVTGQYGTRPFCEWVSALSDKSSEAGRREKPSRRTRFRDAGAFPTPVRASATTASAWQPAPSRRWCVCATIHAAPRTRRPRMTCRGQFQCPALACFCKMRTRSALIATPLRVAARPPRARLRRVVPPVTAARAEQRYGSHIRSGMRPQRARRLSIHAGADMRKLAL